MSSMDFMGKLVESMSFPWSSMNLNKKPMDDFVTCVNQFHGFPMESTFLPWDSMSFL